MQPLFITGCARSGTSAIAGIIDAHGFQGGKLCGKTSANPNGQKENTELRNKIIKPYLKSMGLDPLGQSPLPKNMNNLKAYPQLKTRLLDILTNQGVDIDKPYFWKGAKQCLIWPIFNNAFPEAQWIIVRRNDKNIIDSCMNKKKAPFMRKNKNRKQWQQWINVHKQRFKEMHEYCNNVIEVRFGKVIEGDFEELNKLKQIIEFYGLEWDINIVESWIDKKIWHGG